MNRARFVRVAVVNNGFHRFAFNKQRTGLFGAWRANSPVRVRLPGTGRGGVALDCRQSPKFYTSAWIPR